jgi:formate dehydrogenase iron-sulfur subunit
MFNEHKLIEETLAQQQEMTAVEAFAFKHDLKQLPLDEKRYKELIPKNTPGPGQQYAFEVDLDRCTGCKACVTACHSENGLDEDETWRTVGLVQGGPPDNPALQHVTSACHHCLEPACASGCPVKAYEKDPDTGIVKHLDDQCIGCQYCILKCPYDVPKYNKKRGIVHKCDMCISRLKVGEAPACVRACPSEAIRITLIDNAAVVRSPSEFVKVPDAPDSNYTLPTTRYKTQKTFPKDMVSSDYHLLEPEHSHMPLVVMLVLTQLSVGAFLAQNIVNQYMDQALQTTVLPFHGLVGLGIGLLALGASVLHLGRPLYAFRAVLGFKTSWLSREIVAFGLFAFLSTVYSLCSWVAPLSSFFQTAHLGPFKLQMDHVGFGVFVSGVMGVISSIMVYKDTHRPFWDNYFTTIKFTLTMLLLGFATILLTTTLLTSAVDGLSLRTFMDPLGSIFIQVIALVSAAKMFVEIMIFAHLNAPSLTILKKTALLMTGKLRIFTMRRFLYGVIGGIVLPMLLLAFYQDLPDWAVVVMVSAIFLCSLAGELFERYLFFRAVVPLRMPSGKI